MKEATQKWQSQLAEVARPEKIAVLSSFFKTGKGQYGEGDVFIGVMVPDNRAVAKSKFDQPMEVIKEMLDSQVHEHRLSALLALVERYRKMKSERDEIVRFYLANTSGINNWDLVDLSAPKIVGEYTIDRNHEILMRLAESGNLWETRIAIVATLAHIRAGKTEIAFRLIDRFKNHEHDLIQKVSGWMLREIGKKNRLLMMDYLEANAPTMARTTLRYAIEHLDKDERMRLMSLRK
ncbi:MAG: DNA alkylation repair protein [Muribaculaceae bacterium]